MILLAVFIVHAIQSSACLQSVTFAVDNVEKATSPYTAQGLLDTLTDKIQATPESWFRLPDSLSLVQADYIENSFVGAVHAAYARHYPLVISPDAIWQCIAQGFAIHVNNNAERLRHLFVSHQGRKYIEVREDTFVKGSPDNNWEHTFGQFSEKIRENIGNETHSLLTPEFSTTGAVERAASQVVMMDAFKEYFDYGVHTLCGIPEVTLLGTEEDWRSLREKTISLSRFDLQWWIDDITPILNELVNTASGKINQCFWQNLYKRSGGSGGPFVNGWLLTLFPYVGYSAASLRRNTAMSTWNSHVQTFSSGINTANFPPGFASVPFVWHYYYQMFNMTFHAGFLGVGQNTSSLALQPIIGWAVADSEEEITEPEVDVYSRFPEDYWLCAFSPERNCSVGIQPSHVNKGSKDSEGITDGLVLNSARSSYACFIEVAVLAASMVLIFIA